MKADNKASSVKCRFGKQVRINRISRGFTQERLALRAKMGARHLQKIEAGEVNVTLETISRLARALEIDPSKLFEIEVRGQND